MQSYDLAMLFLRWALAAFFITSGYRKVFVAETRAKVMGVFEKYNVPLYLGIPIIWGQLFGGIALALGFLNDAAVIGLLAIMAGAIKMSVMERVKAASDAVTDKISTFFCTPEVMMAAMLFALAAGGPGKYSLDAIMASWFL